MVTGDVDELGRHPQRAAFIIHKILGTGHAHAALAHAGVKQLVDVGTRLGQNILAHDADVGGAVLDINGHVAGLDEEVAHPGFGVFHHQLAGVVVVLVGAVPGPGQQCVGFIAQAAFGQGNVEPDLFPALLLHRRQRCGQAFQLVQIHRKADGLGPGREALHQVVVLAALEHRAGHACHVAGKDDAIVILGFVGHAQIQLQAAASFTERILQRLQLGQGGFLRGAGGGGLGGGQRGTKRAVQSQQTAKGVGPGSIQPGMQRSLAQLVLVFGAQQFHQAGAVSIGDVQRVQQAGHKAHVADFQHGGHIQRGQAGQRQAQHLGLDGLVHLAHALQPHLMDGLEGVAFAAGAADFLIIIKAFAFAGGGLGRFGDGQRHVRLDGTQLAVQVGKGDDLRVRQKALILLIQGVFLKPGSAVLAVAALLIQGTQAEGRLLGGGEILQCQLHDVPTSRFHDPIIL